MQNSRKQNGRNQAEIANNIYPIKQQVNAVTVNKHKWAWSVATGSSSVKLTLIALTECANSDTNAAYPSLAHLCAITELNRKTVVACLHKLIELNLIEDSGQRVGATGQIVVYIVKVGGKPDLEKTVNCDNSTENGTVPILPDNSTVFTTKQYRKRTETVPKTVHVSLIIPDLSLNDPNTYTQTTEESGGLTDNNAASAATVCAKQKRSATAKPKKTTMPDDFAISPNIQAWADSNGHTQLQARLEHFKNWAIAKGATYANWDAAFRNAVMGDWAKLGKAAPNYQAKSSNMANAFNRDNTQWLNELMDEMREGN